jgi:hypothetical protein
MDELEMERRMTSAEAWIRGHERLCAERFLALRQDIRWVIGGMVAVVFAVMGWMAVQLYNNAVRPAPLPIPVPAVAGLRA